jgi:hypothetical protein
MRTSLLGVAITVLLIGGLDAEGQQERWKKIKNEYFSFSVPASFKKTRAHGIDSFVEEYSGKGIRLSFDYGDYSNDFSDWRGNTVFEILTVDGRPATLGTRFEKAATLTQVHIPLDFPTALSMSVLCQSESDVALARRIFESIHFNPRSSQ